MPRIKGWFFGKSSFFDELIRFDKLENLVSQGQGDEQQKQQRNTADVLKWQPEPPAAGVKKLLAFILIHAIKT
jgi:hypothetical protein